MSLTCTKPEGADVIFRLVFKDENKANLQVVRGEATSIPLHSKIRKEIENKLSKEINDLVERKIAAALPAGSCSGESRALQWNGNNWECTTVLSSCRICAKLDSNSGVDGRKECSEYTSLNREVSTPFGGFAEAQSGRYGGGKYSVKAWLQCK